MTLRVASSTGPPKPMPTPRRASRSKPARVCSSVTAAVVAEALAWVEAQPGVHRGEQVTGLERTLHGMLGPSVGRADDLPGAQTTAGQHDRKGVAPVVAPRNRDARLARVDARRPAKL